MDQRAILSISTPAAIICLSIHAPIKFHWSIAMNAAVYGSVGLAIKPFWRMADHRPARLS